MKEERHHTEDLTTYLYSTFLAGVIVFYLQKELTEADRSQHRRRDFKPPLCLLGPISPILQLPLRVVARDELVDLYEPVPVLVLVLPESLLHRLSHAGEVHLDLVLVEPPVAVEVDLVEEGGQRGPRREPVGGSVLLRLRLGAAPRGLGGAPPDEDRHQRCSQPPSHVAPKPEAVGARCDTVGHS